MKTKKYPASGEILMEEFLKPMSLSQYRLAGDKRVRQRINEIAHGKRAITADTALRLGKYFSMSPMFWLNLQARYDLEIENDAIGEKLDEEIQALAAA
jgi:addiction module HigA family antidote